MNQHDPNSEIAGEKVSVVFLFINKNWSWLEFDILFIFNFYVFFFSPSNKENKYLKIIGKKFVVFRQKVYKNPHTIEIRTFKGNSIFY